MFLTQIPSCPGKLWFPLGPAWVGAGGWWLTGLGANLESKPGYVLQVLVMLWCPYDATSWRWRGDMGTGLLVFCCSKCQCKLGKTCFLKKISTLIRKEMPQWFWKHIRCFLVWSTMCTMNARHFLWKADIFHNNNVFLFKKNHLVSQLRRKKKGFESR